jgi:ATP-dependent Clp protease ATP-binding subunit ClpC
LELGTWNLELGTWNLELGTWNLELGTYSLYYRQIPSQVVTRTPTLLKIVYNLKMVKNKFTKNAIEAINVANKTCVKLQSNVLTIEHLFIGLLRVKEGIGSQVLAKLGLDPDATVESIEQELLGGRPLLQTTSDEVDESMPEVLDIVINEDIKVIFEKAYDIAINAGHTYVGTEHLLLGLFELKSHPFIEELNKYGINQSKIKKELDNFVQYPELNNMDKQPPTAPNGLHQEERPGRPTGNSSFFETFGRSLTNEARQGKLDPVIGREKEIGRLMQILSRRTKNNPILLGDAGVGKTAIVEGLAQRIAEGSVSPVLSGFEIWSIDTASIVAGSQLRGDIEQKILDMIGEIEQRGNIILFIDEIHTIMGAGSTSNNSLDIANILKPALARGALHCIGATTIDEYRQHFDSDPALQRRFQPIDVEELSQELTFDVMKQLKPIYEAFHNVKITEGALKSSIKLSDRYVTDRFLPDKAIDVLDEACAKNKLERVQITPEFKAKLEELRGIVTRKNDALQQKKIEEASTLLDEEKEVMKQLSKIEKSMKKSWNTGPKTITEKEIKAVIHHWTKIPVNSMEENVSQTIVKLEKDLSSNVIGQNYACQAVSGSIKRAKAGLSGFDRPLASFLFVGPTGVGKTELAKQLAKSLFGSKESLIQIDMSELMEDHSVSKLIGSPPGYVGYDAGGQLTDKVRRRPFSVILFDEIEKASPDVLNILLQIMDEGRLTDSKGKVVNFKNTIVIMTSNLGAELLRKDSNVGIFLGNVEPSDDNTAVDPKVLKVEEKIIDELKEYLQPEFLNRIDDVIVFRELGKEDITKIVKLNIDKFTKRLKQESNIVLENASSSDVVDYITELGFSEEYGAREIQRAIRSTLENAVADRIIELNWNPDSKKALRLELDIDEDKKIRVGVKDEVKLKA